ncbi:hypothetical protein [Streptomyces sp. CBMA152]|uniref:hypothetical protein n=1 Tax=Streptomyces sp. CBMA152 TaxID=1896312 RepID=UPI001660C877|nr:hypothetical protein [Streptomyces sp. CBMA152]
MRRSGSRTCPGLRWHYLPPLEHHLGTPHFTPSALLLGADSVAHRHLAALTPSRPGSEPAVQPARTL